RHLIGPCRPLCEHVKARCAPVLRIFDFDWPANLNCSRFPVKNVGGGTMCMEGPYDSEDSVTNTPQQLAKSPDRFEENPMAGSKPVHQFLPIGEKMTVEENNLMNWLQQFTQLQPIGNEDAAVSPRSPLLGRQATSISLLAQSLRHCAYLKKSTFYVYVNRTGRCAPLCQADILFNQDAKTLATIWTSILTGLGCLLTTLTLIGYAMESAAFRISERPVIYIALCQLCYSLGFAISLGLGRETVTCGRDLDSGREIRLQEGLDNSVCALVFMVQYFFSIAGTIWWVLLTVHWALQHSRCWRALCWEPLEWTEYGPLYDSRWLQWEGICSCMSGDERGCRQNALSGENSEMAEPLEELIHAPLSNALAAKSAGATAKLVNSQIGEHTGLPPPLPNRDQTQPGLLHSEMASYFVHNGKVIPSNRYLSWAGQSRRCSTRTEYDRISVCLAREHILVWLTAGLLTVGVLVSRQKSIFTLIIGYNCILALHNDLITSSASVSSYLADKPLDAIGQRRCVKSVPIQIPECQNSFYNFTGMPNFVDQESQLDAQQQLKTFKPLIAYKCSNKLNFFLCSVYAPMCDVNTRHLIGPCRPLCEHVKARCAPVLRIFDFDWPANLNCSRFPVKNVGGGTMCMEGPYDSEDSVTNTPQQLAKSPDRFEENPMAGSKPVHQFLPIGEKMTVEENNLMNWLQQFTQLQPIGNEDAAVSPRSPLLGRQATSISLLAQSLRHCAYLKKSTFYVYVNRTGRCAPLCQADILFNQDAKTLATIWTSILTGLGCLLTTLTLIGYAMESAAFRISERPVIYIALCQLCYSLGFAISLGLGRETVTCGRDLDSGREIRLQEGLDNSVCALVFMVQYFFSIAGTIWWVLLTVHWALQHSRCWRALCWEPLEWTEYGPLYDSRWLQWEGICSCMSGDERGCRQNALSGENSEMAEPLEELIHAPLSNALAAKSAGATAKLVNSQIGEHTGLPPPLPNRDQTQPGLLHSEMASYFVHNGKVIPSNRYLSWAGQSRRCSTRTEYDRISVCLAREHILVWLTAGLLTVGVLVSRQVDADELIPMCGVGRQNTRAMGAFVIGPQVTMSVFGLLTLLVGLIVWCSSANETPAAYTFRHPTVPVRQPTSRPNCKPTSQLTGEYRNKKSHASPTNPIAGSYLYTQLAGHRLYDSSKVTGKFGWHLSEDSLGMRLGLFCFLYMFPAVCVMLCDIYEYLCREKWLRETSYKAKDQLHTLAFPPKLWKPNEVIGPSPEIFMLRIFMSLVPGFTCSLWVWSVKGCRPWKRVCTAVFCVLRGFDCRTCSRRPTSTMNTSHTNSGELEFNFPSVDQPDSIGLNDTHFRPAEHLHRSTHTSHPYATYQYYSNASCKPPQNHCSGLEEPNVPHWKTPTHGLDPCTVQTSVTLNGVETQHSNATTPGYYSQAKVGSMVEPHMSDTFSEESPIPPPLPVSARPQLPLRGDPCIGASTSQVSILAMPLHGAGQGGIVASANTAVVNFVTPMKYHVNGR
ncbi:hypothetical protein AHF37_07467, partial [Paragonimus kellicotti]